PRAATPAALVVTLFTKPWPAATPEPVATNVIVRPAIGVAGVPVVRSEETPLGLPGSDPVVGPEVSVSVVPGDATSNAEVSLLPARVGSAAQVATNSRDPWTGSIR